MSLGKFTLQEQDLLHPEGTFPAVVHKIGSEILELQHGPCRKIEYRTTLPNGDERIIDELISLKDAAYGPNTKLHQRCRALLGARCGTFDWADLLNKPCLVTVGHKEKKGVLRDEIVAVNPPIAQPTPGWNNQPTPQTGSQPNPEPKPRTYSEQFFGDAEDLTQGEPTDESVAS